MTTPKDPKSMPNHFAFEVTMKLPPAAIYRAFTQEMDRWFAVPGTVLMRAEVDVPFFFETEFEGQRHPHYGRFLELVPDERILLTWVTGIPGTKGFETVIAIGLEPADEGTKLTFEHAGFPDEETMRGHRDAWPLGLEILDERIGDAS